jgi:hypothetical protein
MASAYILTVLLLYSIDKTGIEVNLDEVTCAFDKLKKER